MKFVPQQFKHKVKKLIGYQSPPERLMYRIPLYEDFLRISGGISPGKRILEVGPKDGMDTKRLASLKPKELVFIDLPEKREGNRLWMEEMNYPLSYVEANFLYMTPEERERMGTFDVIYFTGILYHNAEQLRFLRQLYKMLNPGGYLVLESATLRSNRKMRNGAYVEIFYPNTYRNTGSVTHLPSKGAINAWLQMVGFHEVTESRCYKKFNRRIVGQRYACIAKKSSEDDGGTYKSDDALNPPYKFGDAT